MEDEEERVRTIPFALVDQPPDQPPVQPLLARLCQSVQSVQPVSCFPIVATGHVGRAQHWVCSALQRNIGYR